MGTLREALADLGEDDFVTATLNQPWSTGRASLRPAQTAAHPSPGTGTTLHQPHQLPGQSIHTLLICSYEGREACNEATNSSIYAVHQRGEVKFPTDESYKKHGPLLSL